MEEGPEAAIDPVMGSLVEVSSDQKGLFLHSFLMTSDSFENSVFKD